MGLYEELTGRSNSELLKAIGEISPKKVDKPKVPAPKKRKYNLKQLRKRAKKMGAIPGSKHDQFEDDELDANGRPIQKKPAPPAGRGGTTLMDEIRRASDPKVPVVDGKGEQLASMKKVR